MKIRPLLSARFLFLTGAMFMTTGLISGCCEGQKQAAVDTGPKVIPITVKPLVVRAIERKIDVVGSLKGWEEFSLGPKKVAGC